jgi:hypothetical protein
VLSTLHRRATYYCSWFFQRVPSLSDDRNWGIPLTGWGPVFQASWRDHLVSVTLRTLSRLLTIATVAELQLWRNHCGLAVAQNAPAEGSARGAFFPPCQ